MEHFGKFLKKWVREAAGKEVVVTDDFVSVTDKPQVIIFLRELVPTAPIHRYGPGPMEFGLRYLISAAGAKSVTEGNELLQSLVFSAMEHETLDVDLSPPEPEFWLSLGVKARPCFNLKMRQSQDRKVVPVPIVTEPVELNTSPSVMLYGGIKSPSGVPISGARVEIPSDSISVVTDIGGYFRFGALTSKPDEKIINVHYKNYSITKTVSISKSPVEILFNKP